jgi:hypothetical protein
LDRDHRDRGTDFVPIGQVWFSKSSKIFLS